MIDPDLIYLHKFLKTAQKDYLIILNNVELSEALEAIGIYTKEFIVLNQFIYKENDFSNVVIKCINCLRELDESLSDIFTFKKAICNDVIKAHEIYTAIFFTKADTDDWNLKKYEYFLLFEKLNTSFYVDNIILHNNSIITVSYTNQKKKVELISQDRNKSVCVFINYGLDGFFMTFSILYELIKKYNNVKVILLEDIGIKDLLEKLFNDKIEIYEIRNHMVLEKIYRHFIFSGKFMKCYNALFNDYKTLGGFWHYYDLFSAQLYDIHIDNPYQYVDELKNMLFSMTDKKEKEYVESIVENTRTKVGLQFWTYDVGVGDLCDKRCWNQSNVQQLIDDEQEVEFYILAPYPKDKYVFNGVVDTSNLSLPSIILLLSKLDYVIAIDSYCGHIAACFNIPTITIWNKQTPTRLSYEAISLSFRVMRNNVSVVPKDGNINNISGKMICTILNSCMNNEISMQKEVFSKEYVFNDENTIYV